MSLKKNNQYRHPKNPNCSTLKGLCRYLQTFLQEEEVLWDWHGMLRRWSTYFTIISSAAFPQHPIISCHQSWDLCCRNPKWRSTNLQFLMTFLLVSGRCWEIAALPSCCVCNQIVARNKPSQMNSFLLERQRERHRVQQLPAGKILSHSTPPPCWGRNIQDQARCSTFLQTTRGSHE